MKILKILTFIILFSFTFPALAASQIIYGPPPNFTPLCGYSCERDYTLFSFYKDYIYEPTGQPIIARISVEPAEYLDLHKRS